MKVNKKIQVHMLPTEDVKSFNYIQLGILNSKICLFSGVHKFGKKIAPQHLYFTSDEKPEVGDLCVYFGTLDIFIMKYDHSEVWDKKKCRKIIATTDTKLKIYESETLANVSGFSLKTNSILLPQPSQSFIEKYCKVGGIDEVLVEYEYNEDSLEAYRQEIYHKGHSDINLEDDMSLKVNSHNEIIIHPIKDNWTREEVVELLNKYGKIVNDKLDINNLPEWWTTENL